jgi:hypothetical protein
VPFTIDNNRYVLSNGREPYWSTVLNFAAGDQYEFILAWQFSSDGSWHYRRYYLSVAEQAGGGSGLSAQETRNAMALALGVGVTPAAGSIDARLQPKPVNI